MRRMHLFELEDYSWFPSTIRNGITDFLEFSVVVSNLYGTAAQRLERAIETAGATKVIDLCSGGGGPWKSLLKTVRPLAERKLSVCLTDLYPNGSAFAQLQRYSDDRIGFSPESVSATDVPAELAGFRTLFSSFHHFRPHQARAILADAVSKGQPVAVFESTQRHPLLLFYMLFTPLLVLLATPFIRPFRWSRLFWTYVLPVIPFAIMFDGIVSCLRTYSVAELQEMTAALTQNGYSWETGVERIGGLPVGVTYLIGLPADAG